MKRRTFLAISALSGLGITLANPKLQAQEPLWRFVAIADTGTGAEGQYAVANALNNYAQQNSPALVLLAGDNIYNDGEIEKIKDVFEKPYRPILEKNIPFHAVLGNHDIRTNNGEDQLRYPKFNMLGRYYTFSNENAQFFALDTNSNAEWEPQLKWLEENLANSQKKWKIVFGHHPVYSSGRHGNGKELIANLEPLFKRYNVSLYICGHDHNYERSVPIEKTVYIVTGAGAGLRTVERSPQTAYSASKLSFTAFDVYEDRIETKAIGVDGRIFDQGKIYQLS